MVLANERTEKVANPFHASNPQPIKMQNTHMPQAAIGREVAKTAEKYEAMQHDLDKVSI